MERKADIENHIIGLAVFTSILSFSPNSEISGVCNTLLYIFWGLAIGYKLIKSSLKINIVTKYMLFVFILFWVLCKLFCYLGFYPTSGAGIAKSLGYCSVFYTVGYNFTWQSKNAIRTVLVYIFIGYFIFMITALPLVNVSENTIIWSKNQLGQMLGSAIIFETFILPKQTDKKYLKVLLYLCSMITLVVLMQIHSRTPLIGIAVITIVNFIQKKNKSDKDYAIAILVILILCLVINYLGGIEFLRELFDWDSDSNISSAEGLNDVTSGRLDGYAISLKDFLRSPIFGLGAYAYMDNFVICTLRTGGIFLAIFILPFVYGKLYTRFKSADKILKSNVQININIFTIMFIVKCFSLYFFVISLMEGYPPVGPGTSVFLLWLMFGIAENMTSSDD